MVLEPGMVFHVWFSFTRPFPKEKFAILGPIEPKPLFLFIDTDINPFINCTDDLRAHHLTIYAAEHAFLEYDSWVDCSYPVGYDLESLCSEYYRQPHVLKGRITESLRSTIISCIETSRLWPAKKANQFICALKDRTPFEF
jgi:hypothetical protein